MIRTNNSMVTALINKQGSNRSKTLNLLFSTLFQLCLSHRWNLIARHIPSHLNAWADSLSRNHVPQGE